MSLFKSFVSEGCENGAGGGLDNNATKSGRGCRAFDSDNLKDETEDLADRWDIEVFVLDGDRKGPLLRVGMEVEDADRFGDGNAKFGVALYAALVEEVEEVASGELDNLMGSTSGIVSSVDRSFVGLITLLKSVANVNHSWERMPLIDGRSEAFCLRIERIKLCASLVMAEGIS